MATYCDSSVSGVVRRPVRNLCVGWFRLCTYAVQYTIRVSQVVRHLCLTECPQNQRRTHSAHAGAQRPVADENALAC